MARALKQFCKICSSPAIVTKTERTHFEFSTIYCQCQNPHCGHTWASNIIFSHTLKKSKLDENGFVQYLISKLPKSELENIKNAIIAELKAN